MQFWKITTLSIALLPVYLYFVIVGIGTNEAQANNNCWNSKWVKKPPTEDFQYRYYVGTASGKRHEAEKNLIDQATKDARETAIGENFGILTSVQKQSYQSLDSTTALSRVSEISKRVILKGFRKQDTCWQFESKRKSLWLLFRYPKYEISKELKRIEKAKFVKSPHIFDEISATGKRGGGFLEVVTSPPGISILIGEHNSKTPVKVRLAPGVHPFTLDSPYFKTRQEKVVIEEGRTQRIEKMMEGAKRKIRITTYPSGAKVELAGKYLGLSPIETQVLAGERLGLLVTHPETQPYRTDIRIGKGPDDFVLDENDIKLKFKPSYLIVKSIPQGADTYLDGDFVGKTPTKFFETRNGKRKLVLKMKNYLNEETYIHLKGGERRILETIRLTSFSEREIHLRDFPLFLGFDIQQNNPQFVNKNFSQMNALGFGLFVEKRFYGWMGMQGKVGYNSGKKNHLELSGLTGEVALPIHILKSITFSPLVGYFEGNLKEINREEEFFHDPQTITTSVPTLYYGGNIGLELGFGKPSSPVRTPASSDSAANLKSTYTHTRNNYTRYALNASVSMVKYEDDRFLKESLQFGLGFKMKLFATPLPAQIYVNDVPTPYTTPATNKNSIPPSAKPHQNQHSNASDRPPRGSYSIQMASYPQEKDAIQKAKTLKNKGLEAFHLPASIGGKQWFRVYVGSFENVSDAMRYKMQVLKQHGIKDGFITKVSY